MVCGFIQIKILSRFSSSVGLKGSEHLFHFPCLLFFFFFFFFNLSPLTFQFFSHMIEASFMTLFWPPSLFFILYFFLRPCYGPGTVLVMGTQGKKTMELQGEIGKSAIIVGDFNTPLSSRRQRSERPQELTVLRDIRDMEHPLSDG